MDRLTRRGAVASRLGGTAALLLALLPSAAFGQLTGSLGIGATGMRAAGAGPEGSESLTPALSFGSPRVSLDLSGALTALPLGQWAAQGRGDAWLVSAPLVGRLRAGVEASGSRLARADASGAALHGTGDLLWDGGTWGMAAGVGLSAGFVPGLPDVSALHARVRAWRRMGAAELTASIEPVQWYEDVGGGVDVTRGPLVLAASLTGRTGAAAQGSIAGGASAELFVLPGVALEAAGGTTLRDPFQGLPSVMYASVGLRVFRTLRRASGGAVPPAVAAAPAAPQPLVVSRAADGGGATVRFSMPGARSVEIAGDWDGWRLHALHPVAGAPGIFAGAVAIPGGRWHFTLLVDGDDWVVPEGIAAVPESGDGGDVVSVLVVR